MAANIARCILMTLVTLLAGCGYEFSEWKEYEAGELRTLNEELNRHLADTSSDSAALEALRLVWDARIRVLSTAVSQNGRTRIYRVAAMTNPIPDEGSSLTFRYRAKLVGNDLPKGQRIWRVIEARYAWHDEPW